MPDEDLGYGKHPISGRAYRSKEEADAAASAASNAGKYGPDVVTKEALGKPRTIQDTSDKDLADQEANAPSAISKAAARNERLRREREKQK